GDAEPRPDIGGDRGAAAIDACALREMIGDRVDRIEAEPPGRKAHPVKHRNALEPPVAIGIAEAGVEKAPEPADVDSAIEIIEMPERPARHLRHPFAQLEIV